MKLRCWKWLSVFTAGILIMVCTSTGRIFAAEGIDLLNLQDRSPDRALVEYGPVFYWITDDWALVKSGTIELAQPLMQFTPGNPVYLISTFQTGNDETVTFLAQRRKIQEHVYLAAVPIEQLAELTEADLDMVKLPEPFPYPNFSAASKIPKTMSYSQSVQNLADAVSTDDMMENLTWLVDLNNRNSYTPGCKEAGTWLFSQYHDLGLAVSSEIHTERMAPNIIAEKRGVLHPEEIVIICGHYDSTNRNKKSTLAPGADDNGTGTVAALQVAKILSDLSFERTIRFIAFSGEEQGLFGSTAYAAQAALNGDEIIGVYNFDMIGWTEPDPEDLDCIGNEISQPLIDHFIQSAALYTGLPVVSVIDSTVTYSDHSPFWQYGYEAICGIEDHPLTYPYYHSSSDTVDKIDTAFFTQVTKTAVAAIAELAVLSDLPEPTPIPAEDDTGIDLILNQSVFTQGDRFFMRMCYWNLQTQAYTAPLFIVLDIHGQYFFWPNWQADVNYRLTDLQSQIRYTNIPVLDFMWPETGTAMDDLKFWAALTDSDFNHILGVYDTAEWSYE